MASTFSATRRKADLEREEEERAAAKPAFVPPRKLTAQEEAAKIFARLGDLSGINLFGNRILAVKFERSTIGSGRLLAAAETKKEDKWQGKIGLVVMKGTLAFKDDADTATYWHGDDVKVGDWIWFQYSDGTDIEICPENSSDRVYCKILREGEVMGVVPRPDIFF